MADHTCTRKAVVSIIVVNCVVVLLLAEAYFLAYNDTLEKRIADYENARAQLLDHEAYLQLGGKLWLDKVESKVNELIMLEKRREYEQAHRNSSQFKPAQNFLHVSAEISKTPLFKLLKTMPKGGVLHVHDLAMCSTEYLVQLTYRENLWICVVGKEADDLKRMQFSLATPPVNEADGCRWELAKTLRQRLGADKLDGKLYAKLALHKDEQFASSEKAWQRFRSIFSLVYGLLTYFPVWDEYMYEALEQFHADGVQYLEMRSKLPLLYDMDNTNYTIMHTMSRIENADKYFRSTHPNWIGLKVIYAPSRKINRSQFLLYMQDALKLKAAYPKHFAGFDLVSEEDAGCTLREYAHDLLALQRNINFFFHAGETNWYGISTDENLIDAMLLGTRRIGHGLALVKHPQVLYLARLKNVAIEISPISNQMLHYVHDFRNHPNIFLLANDYAVVISSDDPSFWHATPLTHDFYITFLGMASQTADLSMLKKLAMNSILYSAMDRTERYEALNKWESQWDAWINSLVQEQDTGNI